MKFKLGDRVRKIKGSQWRGVVVGTYKTWFTNEGYCVESEREHGSVQIYPAAALELVQDNSTHAELVALAKQAQATAAKRREARGMKLRTRRGS